MKKLIVFALLVAMSLLPACNKGKDTGKKAVEGTIAPDFTVKDLAGKEVKLADLKGNVVLVNFWATWCPPCKEEIPSMMKLNQSMTGKPFRMLAISIDEGGKEAIVAFFKKSGMSLPAYLDSDGKISQLYGATGVPETFIVDKTGVIQKKIVGGMDWGSSEVLSFMNELARK